MRDAENRALTTKERLFLSALKEKPGNISAAARVAGFEPRVTRNMSRFLQRRPALKVAIQREIGERIERFSASADAVLERMALMAMTDTTEVVRYTNGRVEITDYEEMTAGARAIVSEISETRAPDGSTTVKVKTHDQLSALKIMCQYHGILDKSHNARKYIYPEQKVALQDVLEKRKTPVQAALWLESQGVPVPDTLGKLVEKSQVEEADPLDDFKAPTAEEIWERRKERMAAIESQREGLEGLRAEVAAIKEELGEKIERFKPLGDE